MVHVNYRASFESRPADVPIRERGRFTQAGFTPEDIQKFGQSFENVWSPEREPIPVNQGYKFSPRGIAIPFSVKSSAI